MFQKDKDENQDLKSYFKQAGYNEKDIRGVLGALKNAGYLDEPHFDPKTFKIVDGDILGSLKNSVSFSRPDFDPETADLEDFFTVPKRYNNNGKMAITSLTNGPGQHEVKLYGKVFDSYEVPEGEIYATIDDIGFLAGSVTTYKFSKKDDELILEDKEDNVRS